jgi:hypothetical protein
VNSDLAFPCVNQGRRERSIFFLAQTWGNKWGNMLHRFQPILDLAKIA